MSPSVRLGHMFKFLFVLLVGIRVGSMRTFTHEASVREYETLKGKGQRAKGNGIHPSDVIHYCLLLSMIGTQ